MIGCVLLWVARWGNMSACHFQYLGWWSLWAAWPGAVQETDLMFCDGLWEVRRVARHADRLVCVTGVGGHPGTRHWHVYSFVCFLLIIRAFSFRFLPLQSAAHCRPDSQAGKLCQNEAQIVRNRSCRRCCTGMDWAGVGTTWAEKLCLLNWNLSTVTQELFLRVILDIFVLICKWHFQTWQSLTDCRLIPWFMVYFVHSIRASAAASSHPCRY